jgi:hypothetical protein
MEDIRSDMIDRRGETPLPELPSTLKAGAHGYVRREFATFREVEMSCARAGQSAPETLVLSTRWVSALIYARRWAGLCGGR